MSNDTIQNSLRSQRQFDYFISAGCDCFAGIMGINMKDVFLEPCVGIEIHKKGRGMLQSLLGQDISVSMPVSTPLIKYGHANCLGSELSFPDIGQVGIKSNFKGYEHGIEALQNKIDFYSAGMTGFYLDYYEKLKKAFPDERVYFGWQWEGPVTSAWELVGESFMYDLYDRPELLKKFMYYVTESIVDYCRFFCEVEGTDFLDPTPDHGRVCDDIAAMLVPAMWSEFVIPYWQMFFDGPTKEAKIHCEDMTAEHLKYLDGAGIIDYDSGISPKLNPKIINEKTSMPFGWRLGSFNYESMTGQDVSDFVFQAVADGASYVFTCIERIMCEPETIEKIRIFYTCAEKAKQMLDSGKTKEDIGALVSAGGREKFWNNWHH